MVKATELHPPIRLLLADDHQIMREGIRSTLSAYPHIKIVGEVATGTAALRAALKLLPDVILLDISMPLLSGLDAISLLRTSVPNSRVIALTMHDSKEYVLQAVRGGARGYVLKDTAPEDLVRAIEEVFVGKAYLSPNISPFIIDELNHPTLPGEGYRLGPLTERETQVLKLLAQGSSNKEIASTLNVGVRTIETHRERVMSKLQIRSVAGLTRFAITSNLL